MSAFPSPLISAMATVSLAPGSIICRSNAMSSGRVAAHANRDARKTKIHLCIAHLYGLRESFHRVARGDEFLPHITLVAGIRQSPHHRRIVNLLGFVEF